MRHLSTTPAFPRRSSSAICRRTHAWRSRRAGTGFASCRPESSLETAEGRCRPPRKPNAFSGHHRRMWRSRSSTFTPHWRGLPIAVTTLPARRKARTSAHWPAMSVSWRSGRDTARRTSGTGWRWCMAKWRASTAGTSRRCTGMKRPFNRPGRTASSRTRRWPMKSPRSFSWPADRPPPARPICMRHATATRAGAPTGR